MDLKYEGMRLELLLVEIIYGIYGIIFLILAP